MAIWRLSMAQLREVAQNGTLTAQNHAAEEIEKRKARQAKNRAAAHDLKRRASEGDPEALARLQANQTEKQYKRQRTFESLLGTAGQEMATPVSETPGEARIKSEPAAETPEPALPEPEVIEISDDEVDARTNDNSFSQQHSQTPQRELETAHGLPRISPRPRTPANPVLGAEWESEEVLQKQLKKKKIEARMLEIYLQKRSESSSG